MCSCSENGISHCNCKRLFSQPDCNIGWDSSRDCYFSGYHLYMFVASDSANDLPVFPILERASRHDMLSFLHTFFTMKTWLPQYRVTKLLLDAAHDADAVYRYCQESGIQPFIDLNSGNTGNFIYKDTFTINNNGVPVCKLGLHMKPVRRRTEQEPLQMALSKNRQIRLSLRNSLFRFLLWACGTYTCQRQSTPL